MHCPLLDSLARFVRDVKAVYRSVQRGCSEHDDPVLGTEKARKLLPGNWTQKQVRDLCASGGLKATKVGSVWVIKRSDLAAYRLKKRAEYVSDVLNTFSLSYINRASV